MNILVIGGGLIGVTSAYFLRRRGHNVTVIDRQDGPVRESSFANGALLTPSMPEPWNAPGSWRVLLGSLGSSESPLQLRLNAMPGLVGWGITFLRNSRPTAFERNTRSNLRLALYSLKHLRRLRAETRIEYDGTAHGTLKLFRTASAMNLALIAANRLGAEGLSFRGLSRAETVKMEPAIAPIAEELAGAIHYGADEAGDAYQFGITLAEYARQLGVVFSFGTTVSGLEVRSGSVIAARTSKWRSSSPDERGRMVADRYVMAAASYSTELLRPLGIHLPVRPVKGYSVTFDLRRSRGDTNRLASAALKVPIVDDVMHAAVVPIGSAIRVAGTAEFAGFDLSMRPERVRNLIRLAHQLLPEAGLDLDAAKPWCGLRPMSADGVPLIGFTRIANLLVSTGHGHLGWTQAAGSARLLTDLISGEGSDIDPAPYDPNRFE
jgi:D-amino-acid dehydrogenase